MLKTLRITSFIAVVLAICGVAAMLLMGLKENPQVQAFLEKPGIMERFKGNIKGENKEEAKASPLVAQAKAFALRIDPPPPPAPPPSRIPKEPTPPKEVARANPTIQPPTPKVQVSNKFDVLATVKYESAPEKSLVLLKTTGNKQEWFRQGEMAGNLKITEVRDGSVIFSQGNKELPEVFVPVVNSVKSLLKSDQRGSSASRSGPGSVSVQLPVSDNEQQAQENTANAQNTGRSSTTDSGNARLVRPAEQASRPRADVTTRIQRARTTPPPPSPQEQRETLNETMSSIEELMNVQDESISEEERKQEQEMWMELMKTLNAEKEMLEKAIEAEDSPKDEVSEDEVDPSEEVVETTPEEGDNPAVSEPNSP